MTRRPADRDSDSDRHSEGDGDSELPDAILGVAKQIAALLGALPRTDLAMPGSDWTVAEAAAHLAMANRLMAQIAAGRPSVHGDGTRTGLAEANARALVECPERGAAVLGEQIVTQAAAFLESARVRPATEVVSTPLGPMELDVLSRYLLAHMLSHGSAMAHAAKQPPMVRSDHVALVLPFIVATMPRLVDGAAIRGLRACYELRIRGGARLVVQFDDGTVTIGEQPHQRIDCRISIDPVAFFLLAAGLTSQWSLLARGKLGAWGRRPWRAPRFTGFFAIP
jgi:uncharacterized protein (TIGR03083 family)